MPYLRVIMHLDMNSYFASVEQQANPLWRGKPLGVAAQLKSHGCLIATSKEAKQQGIVTGMRVLEGLTRDPNLVVVEVDPSKYRSTTERIFSILAQYSEQIEAYSIDEAFVDLTGWVKDFAEADRLGSIIQRRIHDEVGEWLTCSMGIAPTRWLAKFGSDTAPKGGRVILHAGNLQAYLRGRPLTEAWGIAHRLERRLKALGIHTLDELRRFPVTNLIESLGFRGYELWANLNAVELAGVQLQGIPKSIGHSHVLRRRTRDLRFARAVLMKLCERTGRRLRSLNLEARGLEVFWSTLEAGNGGLGLKLGRSITDSRSIFRLAWRQAARSLTGRTPTSLAVALFWLRPETRQRSFWPTPHAPEALNHALDVLNDRFGEFTVVYGTQLGLPADNAPDRVGFRKTVSWDIPLDQMLAAR